MGGSRHGVICTTRVGREFIDGGTLCRTRSSSSGPLGMLFSMTMGGALPIEDEATRRTRDAEEEKARQLADDETLFRVNVDLIAGSPFGKSPEGVKVVQALRRYLGSRNILYGGTIDDGRADWDGETIRLNDTYRAKAVQTIVELVHEGSHVVWRSRHPKPRNAEDARTDDEADEALARKNQLAVYTWLRATKGLPADEELERRLRRTGGHSGGERSSP
ncbi:hypothetical protein EG835_01660 [bacterium]|nr:hypothetical protein [bacterium]